MGAMVLRSAGVVDQCHSDNIDIENVRRRSWRILWRGRLSARAKGPLRRAFVRRIGNQRVSRGRFALVLSDSLEQQRAAVRSF